MIDPKDIVFDMICCCFQLLEKSIVTIMHSLITSGTAITWEGLSSYFESRALVCLQ